MLALENAWPVRDGSPAWAADDEMRVRLEVYERREARIRHAPRTERYTRDLTDAEGNLIKPMIPAERGGRPRKTDRREVMNAVC